MKVRLPFQNTLARQFLLAFALCIVTPVVLIGVFITSVNERVLVESSSRRILQLLGQVAYGLEEEAKRISLLTAALINGDELSNDERLIDTAIRYNAASDSAARYVAGRALDDRITSFFNFTNKIGAVQIFFRDRDRYILRNSPFLFEEQIGRGTWYDDVLSVKNSVRLLDDFSSHSNTARSSPVLSVAVCPGERAYRNGVEVFLVSFKVDQLETILNGSQWLEGEEIYLLDSAGKIILSNRQDLIGQRMSSLDFSRDPLSVHGGSTIIRRDGRKYLAAGIEIPQASWTLVGVLSYGRITAETERSMSIARYGLLLMVLLFLVYAEISFLKILQPLRTIIRKMKRVEKGDFSVSVDVKGVSELKELGFAFNTMVAEVSRLTREKEEEEKERMRLEMESLRFQINPHFLSNTLNSIRLMAAISKADSISEMTASLMRVVADSFSEEGAHSSVRKELENLKSYTYIMKIRYGERFSDQYDIAEEVLELQVLKMLLQPLVENSILHGFTDLRRKGVVTVRGGLEEGILKLEVYDNGKGMTGEEISRALREPHDHHPGLSRVGLRNVARRIRLNYGDPFSLSVESSPGEYTRVVLTLPVIGPEAVTGATAKRGGEASDV